MLPAPWAGWLMALARSRLGGWLAGGVFAYMSFALPVQRLRETPTLLAFYHPRPTYPVHILLVPKRARASLAELGPADADFLVDLYATVSDLVSELGLAARGYRLVVNGGAYQEVGQVHFHLICDTAHG